MNTSGLRRLLAAIALGLLPMIPTACAVDGATYGGAAYGGGAYDYGPDYYEPNGYDYGGWGDGYFVGPYREWGRGGFAHRDGGIVRHDEGRGGFDHRGGGRGPAAAHAFRSAPASHGMPSIPSGARGGGPHGGRR